MSRLESLEWLTDLMGISHVSSQHVTAVTPAPVTAAAQDQAPAWVPQGVRTATVVPHSPPGNGTGAVQVGCVLLGNSPVTFPSAATSPFAATATATVTCVGGTSHGPKQDMLHGGDGVAPAAVAEPAAGSSPESCTEQHDTHLIGGDV